MPHPFPLRLRRRRRRAGEGFTLLEMLVVLVIIGLLAGLVAPRLFSRLDASKVQATDAQVKMLRSAVMTMQLDIGRIPTGDEALALLSTPQHAMGEAFNDAKNDDTFYLPPETFNNEDFKRGMDSFISPDGKSVRFMISHQDDPLTPDGITRLMDASISMAG